MNTLVLYDSMYGNTEKIAKAIFKGISGKNKTIKNASEADSAMLKSADILIIGSPTQGGRPTPKLQQILDGVPAGLLKNLKFAAFDTRFSEGDSGFFLKRIIKFFGYAAPRISQILKSKGVKSLVAPEGFIVTGKEGPLKEGELERAERWILQ